MLKQFFIVLLLTLSISCTQQEKKNSYQVTSPDNKNKITFELNNGTATYRVAHGDKSVLNKSHLGFVFKGQDSLSDNFDIVKVDTTSFNESWEQVWGEKQFIKNNYRQLSVTLIEKSGEQKRKLEIQFRAFDDGIALRYIFPEQGLKDSLVIMDELTTFNLNDDGEVDLVIANYSND